MARPKIRSIAPDEIVDVFYVRKELSEKRVSQLIKLAQAGTILPPLLVYWNEKTEQFEMIDGRHRREQAKRMELATVECELIDEPDIANRIALAVAANAEGALTPTDDDFMAAIGAMIDRGISRQRILNLFPLPKGYTMKLYGDLINYRKIHALNKARAAMAEANLTLAEAAAKHKVDVDDLKAAVHPKKGKARKIQVMDFIGAFSARFKSLSSANAHEYKAIFDAYEAGHLSAKECRKLWKNVAHRFAIATSALEDWRGRFEIKVLEVEGSEETPDHAEPLDDHNKILAAGA